MLRHKYRCFFIGQVNLRNFFGGDPFLAVDLPHDGTYLVEVRDTRYFGNPKYVYCLEIAEKPFVHAVFPLAIQRGSSTEVELIGPILGGVETVPQGSEEDRTAIGVALVNRT